MQCPSCRFENMPGLTSCGRCGSVLDFNAAAIDVHPPRASKVARRVRRVVPRKVLYEARNTAADARRLVSSHLRDDARIPLPESGVAVRLIVPGWAHIYVGSVLRGRGFLTAYLLLLALGLSLWGTGFGSIFLGLAFSVHASSVLDVLVLQGRVRFPAMMATAGLVAVLLAVLVYLPAGWVLNQLAAPITYDHDAEPFRRLDVVLVNRWAFAWRSPRPGDVVLFRPMIGQGAQADYGFAHIRVQVEENTLIDRVVGGPGDRVVWNDGALTLNGERVPWAPMIARKLPNHLDITVPADRFLILPTTSRAMTGGQNWLSWKTSGLVTAADIEGGVFLRNRPPWRYWFIR